MSQVIQIIHTTSGNGKGQIQSVTGPNGVSINYTYDSYGRITQVVNDIPNDQSFTTSYGYDTWNNNTSISYPSGITISNYYNKGVLIEIKRNGQSIWKLDSITGLGQPKKFTLGNSSILKPRFTYDYWGTLISKSLFPGNNQIYSYDTLSGNIIARNYITKGVTQKDESFSYDSKLRLISSQVQGQDAVTIDYDDRGNILSKYLVGTFNYNGNNINRLDSLTNIFDSVPRLHQRFSYTDNNMVSAIMQDADTLNLLFNPKGNRIKTILKENGATTKTKYFLPGYEKIVTSAGSKELYYVYCPFGLVAIITKEGETQNIYYTETDHLGSIIGLIRPDTTYAERFAYDAWGRRRNPIDWTFNNVTLPQITDRGYTGHEHLDKFKIINMNGRTYDPFLGRFLSVDPVIQYGGNSQSFNGYGYCLNNPLHFNDPSGYLTETFYNFVYGTDIQVDYGSLNISQEFGAKDPRVSLGGGKTAKKSIDGVHYEKGKGWYDRYGNPVPWDYYCENIATLLGNDVVLISLNGVLVPIPATIVARFKAKQELNNLASSQAWKNASFGSNVASTIVGGSAYLANIDLKNAKYNIRNQNLVKQAESWERFSNRVNIIGGTAGVAFNTTDAINDNLNGNTSEAWANGIEAAAYAVGVGFCLFPGGQVVGGVIILVTTIVDSVHSIIKEY